MRLLNVFQEDGKRMRKKTEEQALLARFKWWKRICSCISYLHGCSAAALPISVWRRGNLNLPSSCRFPWKTTKFPLFSPSIQLKFFLVKFFSFQYFLIIDSIWAENRIEREISSLFVEPRHLSIDYLASFLLIQKTHWILIWKLTWWRAFRSLAHPTRPNKS